MTRYHSFMLQDHGLEIGWTWLAPSVQRTGVNTECKYLLLCHAFEAMGAIRVQLRTHHLNTNSQRAIERLGAVREGGVAESFHYARWFLSLFRLLQHHPERVAFCQSTSRKNDATLEKHVFSL